MSRATHSERSPLLRIQSRQSDASVVAVAVAVAPSTARATALCLLLVAAWRAATLLAALASEDLGRAAVCRRRGLANPADDERCHGSLPVMQELMGIQEVEAVLAAVAAIVAPIPLGVAADRWGRRPFLVLALVGSLLNVGSRMVFYGFPQIFPPRLAWLSSSLEIFTGGGTSLFAIIYTILTDVTLKTQRSTTFFYIAAVEMLATQMTLKLRELLTDWFGPWPSMVAALGILGFAVLCALCIHETMLPNKLAQNEEAVQEEPAAGTAAQRIRHAIHVAYKHVAASMAALFWRNKRLGILLVTLLMVALNVQAMGFLPLYVSRRYHLALDKLTLVYRIETVSHFICSALLLPLAAHAMHSLNFSARQMDTTFVRWGIVAAAIGLFGVGLAPKIGYFIAALVLYALITAYNGGILGLLSQLTSDDHVAATFATSRVLAMIGILLSGPVFESLFRVSMNGGTAWLGLPYLVLGCIFALTAVVVFAATSGWRDQEAERRGQDSERS